MYCVFVQLGDGELLYVASRGDFEEAVELAEGFKVYWPHHYVVLNSEGNDIELEESRATSPELGRMPGISAKAHAKSSDALQFCFANETVQSSRQRDDRVIRTLAVPDNHTKG